MQRARRAEMCEGYVCERGQSLRHVRAGHLWASRIAPRVDSDAHQPGSRAQLYVTDRARLMPCNGHRDRTAGKNQHQPENGKGAQSFHILNLRARPAEF